MASFNVSILFETPPIRLNAGYPLSRDICQAIQLLADWVKQQINIKIGEET